MYERFVFKSRFRAEVVLRTLREVADTYGVVTVQDYCDVIGAKASYNDDKVGWLEHNLKNAYVCMVGNDFVIKLPNPYPLCVDVRNKPVKRSTPEHPSNFPRIKKVLFNDPATIVFWDDNTKTVVKCSENDDFDWEKGLAMAISKKFFGNQGNYYNNFKKWEPEESEECPESVRIMARQLANSGWQNATDALGKLGEELRNLRRRGLV